MLPFKEKILSENVKYILVQRQFDKNLNSEELNWHMDKEDREIILVEGEGWYIQLENKVPQLIPKESFFKIPKETWHRIINKNGSNLLINIRKFK